MFVYDALSYEDYAITMDETVGDALRLMEKFSLEHIPLLDDKQQLQGVLSKELLADENPDSLLSSLRSMQPILAYVLEDQHILDALQSITAYGLDVLPVLSHDRHFQGYVDHRTLVKNINQMLGNQETGAIIVLDMGLRDLSFAHLAHLIELEDTRILCMSTRELEDTNHLEVTIKVNTTRIAAITSALQRNNYRIKAVFNDGNDPADIKSRYEMLMNYLEL